MLRPSARPRYSSARARSAVPWLATHSRAKGALALCAVIAGAAACSISGLAPVRGVAALPPARAGSSDIGAFFLTVGAFSFFGGGLSMIAFIQDQVANQYAVRLSWQARELIDGLALGQLTPGLDPDGVGLCRVQARRDCGSVALGHRGRSSSRLSFSC